MRVAALQVSEVDMPRIAHGVRVRRISHTVGMGNVLSILNSADAATSIQASSAVQRANKFTA